MWVLVGVSVENSQGTLREEAKNLDRHSRDSHGHQYPLNLLGNSERKGGKDGDEKH